MPKEISIDNGAPFVLDKNTKIAYPQDQPELQNEAELLSGYIEDIMGFRPEVIAVDEPTAGAINLKLEALKNDNEEAYQIIVNQNNINITCLGG